MGMDINESDIERMDKLQKRCEDTLAAIAAFKEGNVVQIANTDDSVWREDEWPGWHLSAHYRPKPEPRECWVLHYPRGTDPWTTAYDNEVAANKIKRGREGVEVIHMREVGPEQ